MNQLQQDLDTMRDVYMAPKQREAYERICAMAQPDFFDTLYSAKARLILDTQADDPPEPIDATIGMTTGEGESLTIFVYAGSSERPIALQPVPESVACGTHRPWTTAFKAPQDLAEWLDSLCEVTPDGALTGRKWAPAQRAAIAARGGISEVEAKTLAQACAYASCHQHNYLPKTATAAHAWEPHQWVIDAIRAASAGDRS